MSDKIFLKSKIGHYLREVILHCQRSILPRKNKSILIFPCSDKTLASSRERAYNLSKYLRQLGWRVIIVPFQLELPQRRRILALEKPDILYIQKGRHPLNYPQLYQASQIVFDLDDADFLDPNQTQQIIDCCQGSKLVICGSQYIANYCHQYNPNTHIIWSGMNLENRKYLPSSQRKRIVAWGTSDAIGYAQERKFLLEVVIELRKKIDFEFWIYGLKNAQAIENDLEQLKQNQIPTKLFSLLSLEQYHDSLEKVAVGLHAVMDIHPYSLGKSFGKVNSYMQCGVPIVVHNRIDYPNFFEDGQNGMLAAHRDEWVEKIEQLLINPQLRDSIATQATVDFKNRLSSQAVAQRVHQVLLDLI
ncbi:glycosyltransferase [Chroococcus sp. FPU101]|uniref:glycosyltransferase family protein n=1 Tax=Chroococcus sp. FPU101 TaxID=1974212 RepID=UPI001A8D2E8F|nr:glycosyltransferase [Chroococcus sp. FPU101]GFE70027.1 hypothetical protein CFPU101_26370 [Chroococcus sp. FPU101]